MRDNYMYDKHTVRAHPKMTTKENKDPGRAYEVRAIIDEDQREYFESVREFLSNGLRGKGKIVGGPTDDLDLEKKTYIGESLVA